jgi:PAS domain S-box-containing protein
VEARRRNLQGFVLGVYRIHGLLESVSNRPADNSIDIYLFDESAPRGERFLHFHPAAGDDQPEPPTHDEAELRKGMHHAETVDVAGRTWSVVCVPAAGFVPAGKTWQPWGILAGGLVATGFVSSYIFLILMRVVRTREHAAEMTRAKEGLEREMRERRRTEEALRESEEGYRISIESSNDGFAFSMEGRLLFFNRRLLEIFGYSHSSELVGRPISTMVHPEDRERVEDMYRRRMEGEAVPSRYEFRGIRKDGTPVDIEISSAVTTYLGETVNLAHLRDVTDRKRSEAAVRASEEKYRMIFEHSPIGICHFDGSGNVTDCNETLLRIMGAPREKVIGFNMLESVRDPKMKAAVHEPLAGRFGHYEGNYLSVTGGKLSPVKADFGPIVSADGFVVGGIGIFEDIAERRRLEEELRHAQKMEAIGTLTGGLAHEYNNIMTAILGYGEFLSGALEEGSKLREYADVITASAERAARLTDGLLTYSRKQMTNMEAVDVNEVVRATERYLAGLVSEGIELQVELADVTMIVLADKAQMEHVLINLATNAIDAMPDGGTLTMRCERADYGSDVVKQHARIKAGAYAVVTVTDTGVGIDRQTQEKMFEPFFTTKEVGKGTGLGLSMVYGIIERHGGYVSVESDAGRGAAFTLYLPLSDVREERREASLPEGAPGGRETVLLAEDDEAVRSLITSVLTGAGYTVIEAVDGEDAVRKFGEHRDAVELLLFDVVMPRKNGTDACREIREMSDGTRVVFMSGYLSEDARIQAICDEGNPLIWKPVKPKDLLRVVRLALDAKSA